MRSEQSMERPSRRETPTPAPAVWVPRLPSDEALRSLEKTREDVSTTSLNLHELLFGLKKYAKPEERVMQLRVLAYGKEDAGLSSRLELAAERRGMPVRRTDAMIAATTINRSAKPTTFDLGHFEQFEQDGLRLFRA